MPPNTARYEQDVDPWTQTTAAAIRASVWHDLVERSPGRGPHVERLLHTASPPARRLAQIPTRLPLTTFPATCPWTLEQGRNDDFFPEADCDAWTLQGLLGWHRDDAVLCHAAAGHGGAALGVPGGAVAAARCGPAAAAAEGRAMTAHQQDVWAGVVLMLFCAATLRGGWLLRWLMVDETYLFAGPRVLTERSNPYGPPSDGSPVF